MKRARPAARCGLLTLWLGFWLAAPTGVSAADGLETALAAALANHPAIGGKRAEVEASEYAGDAARSQRYPTLSVQTQNLPAGGGNVDSTRESSTASALRARQPLWAFDRIDSSIALADADVLVGRADLLRVRRQIMENTAVAYARVLGERARLAIARESVAAHQALLDQIRRRERGQIASRADIALAANRLAQAVVGEVRLAGELDIAQSDLLALTQIPVAATELRDERYRTVAPLDELKALAVERSADALFKSSVVERARAQVRQTRTASMPILYLQADKTYGQNRGQDLDQFSVVLEATLDGAGLGLIGRAKSAASRQAATEQDLQATRIEIARTAQRLHSTFQTQRNLTESLERSWHELVGLSDSYKRQYEAGTKSWLDVLNIERELHDMKLQRSQAESERLIAALQLMALTGNFETMLGMANE